MPANLKKRLDSKSISSTEAHQIYLRDDLREWHWVCRAELDREAHQGRFTTIRTPGGIHFARSGASNGKATT